MFLLLCYYPLILTTLFVAPVAIDSYTELWRTHMSLFLTGNLTLIAHCYSFDKVIKSEKLDEGQILRAHTDESRRHKVRIFTAKPYTRVCRSLSFSGHYSNNHMHWWLRHWLLQPTPVPGDFWVQCSWCLHQLKRSSPFSRFVLYERLLRRSSVLVNRVFGFLVNTGSCIYECAHVYACAPLWPCTPAHNECRVVRATA